MTRASISRMVHYVSYGTPGGEYRSVCRSAVITEVDPDDPTHVGLCVLNPSGAFFKSLADGGCTHLDPAETGTWQGGTWHWPERVD